MCPPQRPCATRWELPRALSRSRPQDLQQRRTPHMGDASPAPAIREGRDDTAAAGSPPPTGGPNDGRHNNGCGVGRQRQRPRASQPCLRGPPHTTRQHSSNARRFSTPAGKTSTCPACATDTKRVEASLSSPWCRTRTKTQRLPPTSPGRGPHFPDPRNPPATEKGTASNLDPSFHLTLLSREPDPQGAGPRGQPNTQDPRPGR